MAVGAGSCCYVAVSALLLAVGVGDDGSPIVMHSWPTALAAQSLYGLSRAAWESVNAAAIAEWFAADDRLAGAAFSARLMFDGLGGAIAF